MPPQSDVSRRAPRRLILRPPPHRGGALGETGSTTQDCVEAQLRAAGCVYAEDEALLIVVAASGLEELASLVERRCAGEPLEHVLGWVDFGGRRLSVGPGVFVPRRRTELLATEAATLLSPGDVLVDLCCGCGAVAAAVTTRVPGLSVHACDLDPAAAGHAWSNLPDGDVHVGDLYDALPLELQGTVAVITANAPYVPTGALGSMAREARLHEPRLALDGGHDGLDVQRRIALGARGWLRPGGHLLVETSTAQAALSARTLTAAGLEAQVVRDPELDATIVVGRAT